MEKKQVVDELFRPAIRKFKRRRTIIKGLDDLWQADLAEFCSYSTDNRGYKYVLVVIDCFSKFLWTYGLKSKSMTEVSTAMKYILENSNGRIPKNIQTDQGTEFFNSKFATLMKKFKINHYNSYSIIKASMAERVIRTVKSRLYKLFTLHANYNWIDGLLDRVTEEYNDTKHHTTKLKPNSVNELNEKQLLQDVYTHLKIYGKTKFKFGDIVRLSKYKMFFEKGYTPNWTTELFRIIQVNPSTDPPTYLIEDLKGLPVKGCFYERELLKTKQPDIYLVEKVLRKSGSRIYVKYLGMPDRGWLESKDLV